MFGKCTRNVPWSSFQWETVSESSMKISWDDGNKEDLIAVNVPHHWYHFYTFKDTNLIYSHLRSWSSYSWKTEHLFFLIHISLSFVSFTSCWLDTSVPVNRLSHLFETFLHLCHLCPAHLSGPLPPASVAFCLLLYHLNIDEMLGPLLLATGCLWGILRYNSVMVAWQEGTCRTEEATHWCKHGPKRTLLLLCLPPASCFCFSYLSFWLAPWSIPKDCCACVCTLDTHF